jgi:hypothetical protein
MTDRVGAWIWKNPLKKGYAQAEWIPAFAGMTEHCGNDRVRGEMEKT